MELLRWMRLRSCLRGVSGGGSLDESIACLKSRVNDDGGDDGGMGSKMRMKWAASESESVDLESNTHIAWSPCAVYCAVLCWK